MGHDLSTSDDHELLHVLTERGVQELARRIAEQSLTGRSPAARPEAAHAGGQDAGPGGADALARLRVLAYISRAVSEQAQAEASSAARAGAKYPQLGAAWGISRQGARRRWPGLVFTAEPPTRPLPTHRSPNVNAFTVDRPYSVLLVEDDPADALLIEEALVDRGMARTIDQVTDGLAALQYLRDPEKERPDLIVLDLNMPRMNGRELLAVLKDDASLGGIPVVVLTTSAAPDDVEDAYRQHANAYVTKPVNLDAFIKSVQGIDAFFLDTAELPPRSRNADG
ncbi:Response regulator rcp1 [Streptomyces sp. ADI96-02]|uniref:response regulator n=1 Tax=unclassified Streptomyces TaxID=2593676 RepID=UPI000F554E55|nr:response regulator [Streptomyces sp. ADI96-02]RPK54542.1 Response regulator rcp1 [Streptomyces sp. ADI96-02]